MTKCILHHADRIGRKYRGGQAITLTAYIPVNMTINVLKSPGTSSMKAKGTT